MKDLEKIKDTAITCGEDYALAADTLVALAKERAAIVAELEPGIKTAFDRHKLLLADKKREVLMHDTAITFLKDALVAYFDGLGGDTQLPEVVVPLAAGIGWRSNWTGSCTDIKALAAGVVAGTVPVDALEVNKKWLAVQAKAQHDMMNLPGCEAEQKTVIAVFTKEES